MNFSLGFVWSAKLLVQIKERHIIENRMPTLTTFQLHIDMNFSLHIDMNFSLGFVWSAKLLVQIKERHINIAISAHGYYLLFWNNKIIRNSL